jgi:hypothetical protein
MKVSAVPRNGFDRVLREWGEWKRIVLNLGYKNRGADPDCLARVPFVVDTNSSGSQDKAGAGEVRRGMDTSRKFNCDPTDLIPVVMAASTNNQSGGF